MRFLGIPWCVGLVLLTEASDGPQGRSVGPHHLRHTSGTTISYNTEDPLYIKQAMGHVGYEFGINILMYGGMLALILGGLMIAGAMPDFTKWYCSKCGQVVGRGEKPNRCGRCGSNRLTTSDPGAGDAVRVER